MIPVLCLLLSAGCTNRVDDGPAMSGRLYVSVEIDPRLMMPDGTEAPVTAAHNLTGSDIRLTLTSESGRYSHTWESLADFPQGEDYYAGSYILTGDAGIEGGQGFDTPRFTGVTSVEIGAGDGITSLTLGAESAFFKVTYSREFLSAYPGAILSLQCEKSALFPVADSENRLLCLDAASVTGYIALPDGFRFRAFTLASPQRATLYSLTVDAMDVQGTPAVSIVYDGGEPQTTLLTPAFLASESPSVDFDGEESCKITLPEGENTDSQLLCSVKPGGAPLSRLILCVSSASLAKKGVAAQTDLLKSDSQEMNLLHRLGLKADVTPAAGGVIDFTDLLGSLSYLTAGDAVSTFTVMAEDINGHVSGQAVLEVTTTPISLSILSVSEAVIGVDRAEITVECEASDFAERVELLTASADSVWTPVKILQVDSDLPGRYRMTVDIGSGSDPVGVRVVYCDEVRATFPINRVMPDFSLVVDAFAAYAKILVVPADPSLIGVIVQRIRLYVDDKPYNLFTSDADNGLLTIMGLKSSTSYTVKATMMAPASSSIKFCRPVSFTTEGTPQLPNADFEERRDGPAYRRLPSGGIFTQTTVEIFNRQHSVDYDTREPKMWANVNDKTFCLKSSRHNTWYMQPSAYSLTSNVQNGTFACELATVGFDPSGEEIAPYVQTSAPYLDYSPNIPNIKYKAAGRLFLGGYSFNSASMTEKYTEGISWNARPMSLNGYYIFSPCDDDRTDTGLVTVEVIGSIDGDAETVIASGSLRLPLCTGWKAFSLPLTYTQFGVKAKKLKVMFASSRHAGSIAEETEHIITTPDPVTATSIGGRLSLDNVYLSY